MNRWAVVRGLGSVATVVGILLASVRSASAAQAERQLAEGEPATSRVLQIGVGGEYGVKLAGMHLNPWGFGLGAHLGYTLPMGLYVGVPFDYFFGTKDEGPAGYVEEKLWQVALEVGYDLGLGREVVLRFKGGLALVHMSQDGCGPQECWSVGHFSPGFGPGLTLLYLGPSFSLTVDARYELVPLDEKMQQSGTLAQGLLFSVGFGF